MNRIGESIYGIFTLPVYPILLIMALVVVTRAFKRGIIIEDNKETDEQLDIILSKVIPLPLEITISVLTWSFLLLKIFY